MGYFWSNVQQEAVKTALKSCSLRIDLVLLHWLNYFRPINPPVVCSSSPAGCADLNSLDSLSTQEKRRQGYIHELIETEEKYMEDLQIVLEVMDTRHV